MKQLSTLTLCLLLSLTCSAQIQHGLRDEAGRHVVVRGFVINTDDGVGELFYRPDDYTRMARLGANYQVIRLALGRLSNFSGNKPDVNYLRKLDSLVAMGRNAGIETVFKMTVYGVKNWSWEDFYLNKQKEQQTYTDAWKLIWNRYQHDPHVVGYDLVNEPRKLDMAISYGELTDKYLIPIYRNLIDEGNKINDKKTYFVQAIFMNKGEAIENNQYAEITTPIDRKNVIYTPHIYQNKNEWVKPIMNRFNREAARMNGLMFVGEWGFPTFDSTDSSVAQQANYRDFYIHIADVFDSLGVGTIKAWFTGNRSKQHFLSGGPSTWAIFSDEKGVGTVERKYITDIIARPYPQAIAGDIQSFKFDHATRTLDLFVQSDNSKGASRIFVGADRHYPDGFSILCGDSLVLVHNPLRKVGLEVIKATQNSNPADFLWDESRQQLHILQWPEDKKKLHLRIMPGLLD